MRETTLTTASALKLQLSRILTSDGAGHVIGALTRKRIRHQGLSFDTRSYEFSPRVRAQMFWGAYEGAETRMVRSCLQDSKTVVELGSSLGVTTAHIAAVMPPGGRLICVEANPWLIPGLRQRMFPRASALQFEVLHVAVTDYCGSVRLAVGRQTVGSRVAAPRLGESTVEVPALTLREILRRTSVEEFDLVSDIEGAEASFLLQDPAALARCRRAIFELHETTMNGRKVSVFQLLDAALATGFQVVRRHGPVVVLTRH
jgi:FkbM family methyltransferase